MHKVYVSAGSNLDDRAANLQFALRSLNEKSTVKKVSSCYETEPVGYANQPWFLNIAAEIETSLRHAEMLAFCQGIEEACGRIRTFRNAPRTLDIDILFFDGDVITEPGLIIPHPRIQDRKFVLMPLAEIAAELVHPILRKTIRVLLEECTDHSGIRRLDAKLTDCLEDPKS